VVRQLASLLQCPLRYDIGKVWPRILKEQDWNAVFY